METIKSRYVLKNYNESEYLTAEYWNESYTSVRNRRLQSDRGQKFYVIWSFIDLNVFIIGL